MKLRYLANLALIMMPTLLLTWAVSAQGNSSPPNLAPVATNTTPLDVVLVIDATQNQAYDPPSMAAYANRPDLGCNPAGLGAIGLNPDLYTNACVKACNDDPTKPCYPFKTVQDAAKTFIDRLRPGYDRVAIIDIDRQPTNLYLLSFDLAGAKAAINNMRVSDHISEYGSLPGEPCPYINISGHRWKCTTSNLGRALWEGIAALGQYPFRDDSVWAVITVATGAADATDGWPSPDPDIQIFGFCPGKDTLPFCRDNQFATHHVIADTLYDAEDHAVTRLTSWPVSNTNGLRFKFFTIGLGRKIVCEGGYETYDPGPPVTCVPIAGNPNVDPDTGYPNGAEQFLRYVASAGDNGYPTTDPCAGAPLGASCGNYYFAPDGAAVNTDLQFIANRLLWTADFEAAPLSGPAPLTVNFTDQSLGDIISCTWDFGDTFTSTETNPTHTYTLPGAYTVTLQISTALEVSVLTRTNYITVYTPVSADFSAAPILGVYPLTVTFTNQSTGDYADLLWDFGDGFTSTLSNPTHTYPLSGAYTVTLQVTGPGGTASLSRPDFISVQAPEWKFYLPLLMR